MKISYRWLCEQAGLTVSAEEAAERFTRAGLECEVQAHCPDTRLDGVVVARIEAVRPHPDADQLRVCTVAHGTDTPAQVVCGAANAAPGLHVALARPGSRLPDGREIGVSSLRGVESQGMLCAASELGLGEGGDSGLLVLDSGAPLGEPLAAWLQLDDSVLVFELTPNRGDCLSLRGLAREAAMLFGTAAPEPPAAAVEVGDGPAPAVRIARPEGCLTYCARYLDAIDAAARSPDWLRERLRRSGLRSVSIVVDITNLVMLECGQPLHAFDADHLQGGITVREAEAGESLRLLNGQDCRLDARDLVIADEAGPVALAGVMGGEHSEVSSATTRLMLESACFPPSAVAGTGRRHKLHSDAVHRFERGVDPAMAAWAIERCTALILHSCGGRAGPLRVAGASRLPPRAPLPLRSQRIAEVLGTTVADDRVEGILGSLGMACRDDGDGRWQVTAPSWRYDIEREVDLIEEVARVIGYDAIGASPYAAALDPRPLPEARRSDRRLREMLADRGFQDVVTYSFVDGRLDERLQPEAPRIRLDNPIAETMDVLRTSLWSGLLPVAQYNLARQQRRLRLFELARVYLRAPETATGMLEEERLAVLLSGAAEIEHWSGKPRQADFFDLKGLLQALMPAAALQAAEHPALHPGRSARVLDGGEAVGWIGELHPQHAAALDIAQPLLLLEVSAAAVRRTLQPWQPQVPDFPASRRDLALEVPETVSCAELLASVREAAPKILRDVVVFDLYRGANLKSGCKGIGLGLIFQDYSRTLTEQEIEQATGLVAEVLCKHRGVRMRG